MLRCPSFVLPAFLALACGGGPTTPPPPTQSVVFTAASSTPAANTFSLRAGSSTATTVTVNMVATSISGVATVFFDLVFDPAILKFTSGSVGPFLASAGGAIDFQAALDTVPGNAPGHLVVSVTLTPATSSVSGSGTLCSFTFTGIVSGTSTLTVANTGVLTPVPQQGIPGIAFPGGTVTVRH